MMEWLQVILVAVIVVFLLSVLYRGLPARELPKSKPKFVLFPKYKFIVQDSSFLIENMEKLKFKKASHNRYIRGHILGDFLAKWVHLAVTLDERSRQATLGSSMVVIAFDTGDLWEIANELRG